MFSSLLPFFLWLRVPWRMPFSLILCRSLGQIRTAAIRNQKLNIYELVSRNNSIQIECFPGIMNSKFHSDDPNSAKTLTSTTVVLRYMSSLFCFNSLLPFFLWLRVPWRMPFSRGRHAKSGKHGLTWHVLTTLFFLREKLCFASAQ